MYDNEQTKNALHAPYQRLAKAEELVNSNALLDYYVKEYKKKFRDQPIFPVNNSHLATMKDISKAAGHRAYALIEMYFKLDPDGWYSKNGYSLEFLKRNLAAVGTALAKAAPKHNPKDELRVETFCDCCWGHFILVTTFDHDFDKRNTCETCIKNNVPPKRVAKEERHGVILKLGAAFPDMPSGATGERKAELMEKLR